MHIVCNFGEPVTCSYLGDTLQLAVAVDDWLLNVIFITNVFIPCFCRLSVFVSIKGNINRKKTNKSVHKSKNCLSQRRTKT